jgi:predicted alpha/beta superfamily hydrolase
MMTKTLFLYLATLAAITTFGQNNNDTLIPKGEMEGVKAMKFTSAINHHDYVVLVKLPESYNDTLKKTYPVMYALDAQWSFPSLMETQHSLLYDNLVQEMIYVGIAFPQNWFANRNRDFMPTHTDFDSVSGGAPKFLEMITKEIIPYIDSAYGTDKKNNGLLGSSSGGLFVLYSMFQQPSPFNHFIANNPSLFYDNQVILKMEKAYAEKNHSLNAKLFLTSGEYEEEINPPIFKNLVAQLKARNYKGLEMESLVVDKTGHGTAGFYANLRGLQFVYGKPDIQVDTALLNKYSGHYEQGMIFNRTGNSLYISFDDTPKQKIPLHAITNEYFYLAGTNGIYKFVIDTKSKVTGINLKMAGGTYYSKKLD